MKKLQHYVFVLAALLSCLAWLSCEEDENSKEEDLPKEPIEESLHIDVFADQFELSDFLPEKLKEWSMDNFEASGHTADNDTPEYWMYAYPSKLTHPEGAVCSTYPKLAFGFNGTGKERKASFTINGYNEEGCEVHYQINLVQLPKTRSGKLLQLNLTNLMPVNQTVDFYSPDFNFMQTPLQLEFDNGVRSTLLSCTKHVATLRVEADAPFKANMTVRIGSEVFNYGTTRVYQAKSSSTMYSEFFVPGLDFRQVNRVNLGEACFMLRQGKNDVMISQAYNDKLQPCYLSFYDSNNEEIGANEAQFKVVSRLANDITLGEITHLKINDSADFGLLASAYAFKDDEKSFTLSRYFHEVTNNVVVRRSTGQLYEMEATDAKYNLQEARWVASDEKCDKFYADDNNSGIASFNVPKGESNPGEKITLTPLANITTAEIKSNWQAVDGQILLNRNQIWENGYVKQIEKPSRYLLSEFFCNYAGKKILNQWFNRELSDVSYGTGIYDCILEVTNPLKMDDWYLRERWQHKANLDTRYYQAYSSFDKTILLPMCELDEKPNWKGYVMDAYCQGIAFEVSSKQMAQYQDKALSEIKFSLPFQGNYIYYLKESSNEIYRMQLLPLGDMELVMKLPSNNFYAERLDEGIMFVSNVVNDGKIWVTFLPSAGKPTTRFIELMPQASLFGSYPF